LSIALPATTQDEYGKIAEALNQMAASLARSEEARKHLVADVAHELRTPLTILQGKLELIQQSGQAVTPETLLPMQDEVLRLSKLVNDLLQLSLAEAGKLPLEKKKTNLHHLLNRLTDIFRMEADEKGVRFHFLSSAEDEVLVADSNRITQVFLNLIGNAIRYTPSGGQVSIHLTEKTGDDRNGLLVSIRDTGRGISEEHLPYLFDRFYRAEDDRARHTGGMGLGLAITKQFVEAHGGYIEVKSRVGNGTTFTVYLPRGKGD
jgi:two-component system sensor histidine kinase BaeS